MRALILALLLLVFVGSVACIVHGIQTGDTTLRSFGTNGGILSFAMLLGATIFCARRKYK